MARRGGPRNGAGRKPKAEKHVTAIDAAEGRIKDRLPQLIDKLFTLADGVMVQKTDPDGGVDVYAEPPHFRSLEYLVNRVMGKVPEKVEMSGKGGGPVMIQYVNDWRNHQVVEEVDGAASGDQS